MIESGIPITFINHLTEKTFLMSSDFLLQLIVALSTLATALLMLGTVLKQREFEQPNVSYQLFHLDKNGKCFIRLSIQAKRSTVIWRMHAKGFHFIDNDHFSCCYSNPTILTPTEVTTHRVLDNTHGRSAEAEPRPVRIDLHIQIYATSPVLRLILSTNEYRWQDFIYRWNCTTLFLATPTVYSQGRD